MGQGGAAAPGKLLQVNAGGIAIELGPRHNMAATTDPGVGDDTLDGQVNVIEAPDGPISAEPSGPTAPSIESRAAD